MFYTNFRIYIFDAHIVCTCSAQCIRAFKTLFLVLLSICFTRCRFLFLSLVHQKSFRFPLKEKKENHVKNEITTKRKKIKNSLAISLSLITSKNRVIGLYFSFSSSGNMPCKQFLNDCNEYVCVMKCSCCCFFSSPHRIHRISCTKLILSVSYLNKCGMNNLISFGLSTITVIGTETACYQIREMISVNEKLQSFFDIVGKSMFYSMCVCVFRFFLP